MKKFFLVDQFLGYQNKKDITNVNEKYLVAGSHDVLVNDGEKIKTRDGITIDGTQSTAITPITSSFDWNTSTGVDRNIRCYQGRIEYRYVNASGTVSWRTLATGTGSPEVGFGNRVNFRWDTWWSSTESKDLLLGVNGTSDIHMWSGGVTEIRSVSGAEVRKKYVQSGTTISFTSGSDPTISDTAAEFLDAGFAAGQNIEVSGSTYNNGVYTIASVTATTITLVSNNVLVTEAAGATVQVNVENKGSWAEERFLLSGTRSIVIEDDSGTLRTFTYTGGESTDTLTGISPSTSSYTISSGAICHQGLVVTTDKPSAGFTNDIIRVHKNQVYYGDETRRDVYISKDSDYTLFTFSSPRVAGEGALLTLDAPPVGMEVQEDAMYISSGKSDWYEITFTLSADITNEAINIVKLKSGPQQGARRQEFIGKIKNSIVYISNEPTFDSFGRVENISTAQTLPLSDSIKIDFDSYDFSDGDIKYFKNQTFIALPREAKVLIYDHQNGYWQPPQTLSISRFAIIDGELYGHSSLGPNTFKLFDDTVKTDLGNPINFVAKFAYRVFDKRYWQKRFDEYYHEGYIGNDTVLTVNYYLDFGGFTTILSKDIDATDSGIIFNTVADGSFGKVPLGKNPFGSVTDSTDNLPKFRVIHSLNKAAFYEYLLEYTSDGDGDEWQIIAQGPNAMDSTTDNVYIKR